MDNLVLHKGLLLSHLVELLRMVKQSWTVYKVKEWFVALMIVWRNMNYMTKNIAY